MLICGYKNINFGGSVAGWLFMMRYCHKNTWRKYLILAFFDVYFWSSEKLSTIGQSIIVEKTISVDNLVLKVLAILVPGHLKLLANFGE